MTYEREQLEAFAPRLLAAAQDVINQFFEEYEHEETAPDNATVKAIRRLQDVIRKARGECTRSRAEL